MAHTDHPAPAPPLNQQTAHPAHIDADPQALARRILGRLRGTERYIQGIVGPPGVGKSTIVKSLTAALAPHPVVVVPMDGFHLANTIIAGTPLQDRKGAIDTFDAPGYALLMQRLRRRDEDVVYAPSYVREIEEPVAAAIAVPWDTQIVITEGNYLLAPTSPWTTARAAIDEVWYLDAPHELRIERLVRRHIQFGKSEQAAHDWVASSDEINTQFIQTTRHRADLICHPT